MLNPSASSPSHHHLYLVGGWPTLLKNMSSSDGIDDIPNWMESHNIHVPNHQPAKYHKPHVPILPISPCFSEWNDQFPLALMDFSWSTGTSPKWWFGTSQRFQHSKTSIFPCEITIFPSKPSILPILDTLQKMTNSLLVNVDIPIDTKRLKD